MFKLRRLLLACFCLLLLSDDVTAVAPDTDGRALVTSATTRWVNGWNAHDAAALGNLLTSDVDFVLVNGRLLRGRNEFMQLHAQQFAGRYGKSVFQQDGEPDFSFIRPDVALVHWRWSISGVENPDGSAAQTYHGIFTWVLVRSRGTWSIRAAQNTVDR